MENCGVREIDGLANRSPKKALQQIYWEAIDRDEINSVDWRNDGLLNFAFMMFSGVIKENYAQKFKKYLLDNKLGEVIETKTKTNPNSNNDIRVYVWTINRKTYSQWYGENKPTKEEIKEFDY